MDSLLNNTCPISARPSRGTLMWDHLWHSNGRGQSPPPPVWKPRRYVRADSTPLRCLESSSLWSVPFYRRPKAVAWPSGDFVSVVFLLTTSAYASSRMSISLWNMFRKKYNQTNQWKMSMCNVEIVKHVQSYLTAILPWNSFRRRSSWPWSPARERGRWGGGRWRPWVSPQSSSRTPWSILRTHTSRPGNKNTSWIKPSLWPRGIGACLRRKRLRVRILVGSDI